MRLILVLGLVGAVTGCGGAGPKPDAQRVFGQAHLDHVADDSPLVFVVDPAARDPFAEQLRARAEADLETALTRLAEGFGAPTPDDDTGTRALRAIVTRLRDASGPSHWRTMEPFAPRPLVLYFAEHALFARMNLKNTAGLRALIEGVAKEVGTASSIQVDGTRAVIDVDLEAPELDSPHFLAVIAENDVRFALVPAAHVQNAREHLLDRRAPARSVLDSGRMTQLARAEGFAEESVFHVDVPALLAAMDFGTCSADVKRMFSGLEQIVLGTLPRKGPDSIETTGRLRFGPAAMEKVAKLFRPAPALSPASESAAMAMSFGFDVPGIRAYAQEVQAALQATPMTCEALASLSTSIAAADAGVQAASTPFDAVDGFGMELFDLVMTGDKPRVSASLFIGARDTAALLGLVPFAAFAPLAPGLESPTVGGPIVGADFVGEMAFLGRMQLGAGNRGVAVALGDVPASAVEGLRGQPAAPTDGPWMYLVQDLARFQQIQQRITELGGGAESESPFEVLSGLFQTPMSQSIRLVRSGNDLRFESTARLSPAAR
jgi:hypothetical protein